MLNALRLYLRYVGVSLRSQMQYRASFIMQVFTGFFTCSVEIVGIWALFSRFRTLRGWSLAEVALFYGLIQVSFALAEGIGRGFDTFDQLVKSGDFDRLLLRPRSAALQVAAREVQITRVGRLAQGIIVLLWASVALEVHWTSARIGVAIFAIFGGICLFIGLFVLQATLAFWSVESLELMNTVTYGGTETGQYPLSIYKPWFRKFFTFCVPLACVTYFPALAILGRDDPAMASPAWFRWSAPLVGVLFLLVCLRIWRFGVRHYRSTGS